MLIDNTLFGIVDKVADSISLIKAYEPPEGYYLCFSGGKDSIVVYDLAKRAKVKFDAHFLKTSLDYPEVLEFIKQFPDIEVHEPAYTIHDLIIKYCTPPTRKFRYCTQRLKVKHGGGRLKLVGIRAEESRMRAGLKTFNEERNALHPIFDWTERDIWEYIKINDLPYCSLYDEGYKRVGCLFCPFQTTEKLSAEFKKYLDIYKIFEDACNEAYYERIRRGHPFKDFKSGADLFEWWKSTIFKRNKKRRTEHLISLFEPQDSDTTAARAPNVDI